jgi:DNA-binding NarL/FixJ family response regulator
MRHYTVLLLESKTIGWTDLEAILAAMPEAEVVGTAASVAAARRLACRRAPDVIIAAATIEGQSIVPALADLRRDCCPAGKIILFDRHYTPGRPRATFDDGIAAFLLWGDLTTKLLRHALAALFEGDIILGSRAVVERYSETLAGDRPPHRDPVELKPLERIVLDRLAEGLTREQIVKVEGLTTSTVKRLIADLFAKYDATNAFTLAKHATERGAFD